MSLPNVTAPNITVEEKVAGASDKVAGASDKVDGAGAKVDGAGAKIDPTQKLQNCRRVVFLITITTIKTLLQVGLLSLSLFYNKIKKIYLFFCCIFTTVLRCVFTT